MSTRHEGPPVSAGRAVVFDFAGVLFHWQPAALVRRVLPEAAADDGAATALAAGIFQNFGGDWAAFDRGAIAVPDLVQRIATRTGLSAAQALAVVQAVPAALRPLPAVVALLRGLRAAGVRLYFLSNMPASYADALEAAHDIAGWFDDGMFSARVGAIKPEPAIYALAAARFGRAPGDLLFFDDVQANVDAARVAGWQALLFTGAAAAQAALVERGLLAVEPWAAAVQPP